METRYSDHQIEATEYRVSKIWLMWWSIFWIVTAVIASVVPIMPVIAFVLITWAIGHYLLTTVILDQHGVTVRRRFITTTETRFPIRNIHSISSSIGPIGSQCDYGTLILSVGNDRTTIKVKNLEGCEDLRDRLSHMVVGRDA